MTKEAVGHITFRHDPISYGGTGMRHPDRPFKVSVYPDPANPNSRGLGSIASAATYEDACRKLAKELAWRHPGVRRLRASADELEKEIWQREYDRLILLPEPTE